MLLRLSIVLLAIPFVLGTGSDSFAQTTFNWLSSSGGSYHSAANWNPAGGPPIFDDKAQFGLGSTYTVTFANAGTQTESFDILNGNVTFSFLNPTAVHNWGSSHTNYVGPGLDANASATLNLTNMFHNPMRGGTLFVGRAVGKTATLNILNNGNWEGFTNAYVSVGAYGVGNLNISTVGTLQKSGLKADYVYIGQSVTPNGSAGYATVSGFNATLTANKILRVGDGPYSPIGNLTISNQGKATVGEVFVLGNDSDANNFVTVTGVGSELVLGNAETTIGRIGGNGTLNILSGAKVTNSGSSMMLADSIGSTGSLKISGSGSQFLSADASVMKIGSGGSGYITVETGGKLTVSQIEVGGATGSYGSLSVSGVGSRVDLAGTQMNYIGNNGEGHLSINSGSVVDSKGALVVGHMGKGTLQVLGGSQLYSTGGRVGLGVAGSSNTIPSAAYVSGAGSVWSMSENLVVGSHKYAEVFAGSGGKIISSGGTLGENVGAKGVMFLSGNNSLWDANGSVNIGFAGQGEMYLSDGAQAQSSGFVQLGTQKTGVGEVSVSGLGSQWNVNGNQLVLGLFGKGDLEVKGGGKVNLGSNTDAYLGETATGIGTMLVSGSGSEFNYGSTRNLQVGRQGTGSLQISQGGVVNGGNGSIGYSYQIGSDVSQGTVKVQNAGSKWNLSNSLVVGEAGNGTLSIVNGGEVSSGQLIVGSTSGIQGEVQLSGLGSKLVVGQNASVGGNAAADGGVGSLNIGSGTTASVGGQLTLWSQGTVALNNGTLKLGSLNDQGGQFQWNSGSVQFTQNTVLNDSLLNSLVGTSHSLANNQTLEAVNGKTLIVGHNTDFAVNGGQLRSTNFTNSGFTTLQQGSIEVSGNFLNDVSGNFGLQNMTESSGGLFTNNGTVSGSGRLEHQLQNNGKVAVNAGSYLINDNGPTLSTNANQIQLAGGRLDVTGSLQNNSGSFITGHGVLATSTSNPSGQGLVNQGTIANSGGPLDIHGDVRNLGSGRILTSGNATTTFWDDVEHNGAEIRTSADSSTVFFGSVTGAGSYTGLGSVFFEGDLKPGNSPADILFEGDLYLNDTSILTIELGGLQPGTGFDQLTTNGNVFLNGMFELDLVNGFVPMIGDNFMIIENLGIAPLFGEFTNLGQGSTITAGDYTFEIDYFGGSGNDFVLSSVSSIPEPGALALAASAITAFCFSRRRRTRLCLYQAFAD